MFAILDFKNSNIDIKLIRLKNIFNSNFIFNQKDHSIDPPKFEYLGGITDSENYGTWSENETILVTI
mgnify:FL=1